MTILFDGLPNNWLILGQDFAINDLSFEGNICTQVNQSVRYVHSCSLLVKRAQKTLVDYWFSLAEDSRTTDSGYKFPQSGRG